MPSAKTWNSGISKRSPSSLPDARDALSSDTLNAVYSALAHPARRQILISLHARGGVMTAGEIADRFKHSWPTTTRHLGVLESAGVLEVGKRGRHRFYALRPRDLMRAADWISAWAADTNEEPIPDERPAWTELPFATMRNVIPPGTASTRQ